MTSFTFCLQYSSVCSNPVKTVVNISSVKLIKCQQKAIILHVNGMLKDIRFLITQKDDRYCRTLKKNPTDRQRKQSYDTSNSGSHGEFGALQLFSRKASAPPNPSKTHLSCHREQPSVYFQLTVWHFLTTHHCLASNILLPPWVSINRNTVELALLIRPNSCLPSHAETQNCFA